MLRKQLEFYLGDPNLKKDKYLQGFLKKNKKGYLDLTIFLNFNKIREIFMEASISDQKQKLADLVNAIEKSDFLKVNSLGNRVKRVSKFELDSTLANEVEKSSTDERTVYIENLPLSCSLEDIVHIFRNCADIVHISLPRNHAKQIKGFAFIEFAVNPLNPNQNSLPSQSTWP
jgi:RNA recognition motif-containing protein